MFQNHYKSSHGPSWLDSSQARLTITLELAINHYQVMKDYHNKDARNFLAKFFQNALGWSLVPPAIIDAEKPEAKEEAFVLSNEMSYPGML